jgi:hypothetical protein
MEIDYIKLSTIVDPEMRRNIASQQIAMFSADNPPFLSDVFANRGNGGESVLFVLAEQEKDEWHPGGKPFIWKLLCLRDEWGNKIKPGDTIEIRRPKNRKNARGPVSQREIERSKVDGTYDSKYVSISKYRVDERGCISCGFKDAGYFIYNYGYNKYSSIPISRKPEYSKEPKTSPDGSKKHIRHWRFAEIKENDYNSLPIIDATEDEVVIKQDKKLRLKG